MGIKTRAVIIGGLATFLMLTTAQAQDAGLSLSPLREGPYLAPMGSITLLGNSAFDQGIGGVGGTLAAGYRKDWWAIEVSGLYSDYKGANGGRDTSAKGATINGLVFPIKALPNLFGIIGGGGLDINHHPQVNREYSLTTAEAGMGYIFPLSWGRYDFGIRADTRFRYGKRESRVDPAGDLPIPNDFKDQVFNIGLQLPLRLRAPAAEPVVETVAVVPVLAICGDGMDNDGDGLIDFPADPGCTAADDGDETDPAQCSDGKDNDGDGLIDFPADAGCTAAEDNDETNPPDPCKSPDEGGKVSLRGCGSGDVIVLRGVNFEFDKANLTVNAKTILDGVADELLAYQEIKIELGGHTDAKGSDAYNQRLSQKRADSVIAYLGSKGVAADRMTAVGYGESKPVADNATDEGRELNRRVELKVTAGATVVSSGTAAPTETVIPTASAAVVEGEASQSSPEAAAVETPPADAEPAAETPAP